MVTSKLREQLISAGAIRFGDFTLASGRKSTVYIDIKKAITSPEILQTIASEVKQLDISFDAVAGVAVGGVPLAVAVSLAFNRPSVIIRKEQKGHGITSLTIGDVKDKKILLIEDVTTSGGSAEFGIRIIREEGGIIDTVISVADRDEGAETLLSGLGIRLIPLVTMGDLVKNPAR